MPPSPTPSTPTAVLGDDLVRVVKLLHHVRQQAPRRHPQVDPMAYPLLFNLVAGPRRVSALAEAIHSDVSTVSRQVSLLVDLGFVTRGPDPDDGRAQALTLTDEGQALLHGIRDDRDRWLRGLLADWDDDDVVAFSRHLRHFAADLEASLSTPTRRTDR
ncbi:MarR family winged helix-turn-helix transcriptional regulator [Fodinibacter luteus]